MPISLYIMHNHDKRYAVCTSMDLRDNSKPFLSEQLAACVCVWWSTAVVEHSSGGTQQWWNTAVVEHSSGIQQLHVLVEGGQLTIELMRHPLH